MMLMPPTPLQNTCSSTRTTRAMTTHTRRSGRLRYSWTPIACEIQHSCAGPKHADAFNAVWPHLLAHSTQLNQELALLPTAPPHDKGGVFELRSYKLKPGKLLEWEAVWCVASDIHTASRNRLTHIARVSTGGAASRRAGGSLSPSQVGAFPSPLHHRPRL